MNKKRILSVVICLSLLLMVAVGACIWLVPEDNEKRTPQESIDTNYDLYWNLDAAEYWDADEQLSYRERKEDGFYHFRMFHDGEIFDLKVKEGYLVNILDNRDLMGLGFDAEGFISDVISLDAMPLEQLCWRWYVKQIDGNALTMDSSYELRGVTKQMDISNAVIYDMTGMSGPAGTESAPSVLDRVYMIADLQGNVTHMFLFERNGYTSGTPSMCQHCNQEVYWIEWTKKNALPISTGHYILQRDVELTSQQNINPDSQICLDLNGKTVKGNTDKRIYSLHYKGAALALMDSSVEQTGKLLASGNNTDEGLCVWVRYGQFDLYGGTLDASQVISVKTGTAVNVNTDTVFNMHGGTIIGGTSKYYISETDQTPIRGLAGSVYVRGQFNLYDGEICDGRAEAYTQVKNGKTVYSQGVGGNVYIHKDGVMSMSGGTIRNGVADNCGGNIYADGVFQMSGGTVEGGRSMSPTANGGSIFITASGTMKLSGGTVTGGTSQNYGGNLYVAGVLEMSGGTVEDGICLDSKTGKPDPSHPAKNLLLANGTLRMSGGTIQGYVQATDTKQNDGKRATIELSDTARITGAQKGHNNLKIDNGGDGVRVNVSGLTGDAKIGVSCKGIFTEKTTASMQKFFTSDYDYAQVCYTNSCLAIGRLGCVCGQKSHIGACTGEMEFWLPWTSGTGVPVTTGNYYLTGDVTIDYQANINGQNIKLDLNGHDLTHAVKAEKTDGFRMFRLDLSEDQEQKASLTITDSTDTPGTMRTDMSATYTGTVPNGQALRDSGNYGMLVWVRNGQLSIYGGILDGSDISGNKNGMVVRVEKDAAFYMYGGTILGGSTVMTQDMDPVTGELKWNTDEETGKKISPVWVGGKGGAIAVYGSMIMTGGTVTGGKAYAGTGVLDPDTGLTYEPSYSGGGNVYVSGTMTMTGGTIEDGAAYDSSYSLTTAEGTSVKNLGSFGGNVLVYGTFNLSGGTISGGSTNKTADANNSTGNGGSIRIDSVGTMNMTGGTVIGGSSDNCGGNMVVYGTLNMSGGIVEKGEAPAFGGNIFMVNGDMTMTGGIVAGDVYLYSSQSEITGLTLSGKPVITAGQQYGLYIPKGKLITVERLESGASVALSASGRFTQPTEEQNAAYFAPAQDTVFWQEAGLAVGKYQCCICVGVVQDRGHSCQDNMQVFQPWTDSTTLPNTTGYYYLTGDVILSGSVSVRTEAAIILDLNGYSVTNNAGISGRTYALRENFSMELTIGDSKGTGKIKLNARPQNALSDEGILVWGRYASSVINLYGITVDATELAGNPDKPGTMIRTAGSLNIYGCTLLGNHKDDTADIYFSSDHQLYLAESSLDAHISVYRAGSVKLAGKLNITLLQLPDGLQADVTGLSGDSTIGRDALGVFTGNANASLTACFTPVAPQDTVAQSGDALKEDCSKRCLCGSTNGTHIGSCTGPVS